MTTKNTNAAKSTIITGSPTDTKATVGLDNDTKQTIHSLVDELTDNNTIQSAGDKITAIDTNSENESVKLQILPGLRPIWTSDLMKLEIPEQEYLVDKLISKGGINALSSKPGVYKTMLAIEIAKCVSNSEPLFGVFDTRQTKALIIDQESGHGRLKKRLRLLGADDANIAILSFANIKMSKEYAEATITYCQKNDIGLVIYDSLTRFHAAKENNADEMSAVLAHFQLLTQAGITVILIHHDPKSGYDNPNSSNTLRGSGDILAISDIHIALQKDKNTNDRVIVKQLKNRDDEAVEDFTLTVLSDEDNTRLWFEYCGDAPRRRSKDKKAEDAILKHLAENGKSDRTDIVASLEGIAGGTMVSSLLGIMADNGALTRFVSKNGKKSFDLPQEAENE